MKYFLVKPRKLNNIDERMNEVQSLKPVPIFASDRGDILTALKPHLITQSPVHLLTPNMTGGELC